MLKKYGIQILLVIICMSIAVKTALDAPLAINTLDIRLSITEPGDSRLFYNVGNGYNEDETVRSPIPESEGLTDLQFILPDADHFVGMRWDIIEHDRGAEVFVDRIVVNYYGGYESYQLRPESIIPMNQITDYDILDRGIEFNVKPGDIDPYLVFTQIPSSSEAPSRVWVLVKGIFWGILASLLLVVLYRLVMGYLNG